MTYLIKFIWMIHGEQVTEQAVVKSVGREEYSFNFATFLAEGTRSLSEVCLCVCVCVCVFNLLLLADA
jgi:hypothetical protein